MELKPYQIIGVEFLKAKRFALLADEMGLGKTPMLIAAAEQIGAKRILVITTATSRLNWAREFTKFSKLTATAILSKKDAAQAKSDAFVISYDFASANFETLARVPWDVLIIDEVHKVKSTEAKRSAAIFGRKGICRNAHHVWCASGTPAPNNASELWILFYSFGLTQLKFADFVDRYCTWYEFKDRQVVTGTKMGMIPEIKTKLKEFTLRRTVEEVLPEMPPLNFETITLEPGEPHLDEDSSLYTYTLNPTRKAELEMKLEYERRLLAEIIEGKGTDANIILALQAIAKSIPTLRRYVGLQKIDPVCELVASELEAGAYQKIVIFAVHRDVVELMRQKLKAFGAVAVYGGSDPKKVQKRVDDFQNDARCKVFIGNIQSAGTALTLTASNQVLMVESDYNPANILQAPKRCHRYGQEKPVFVRTVTLNDPVEESVNRILLRKVEELKEIFDL